jgi:oligoendopeptidase F
MPKTKKPAAKAAAKTKTKTLPPRKSVPLADQWNLASLFAGDAEWEAAFTAWEKQIPTYATFKGRLAESAATLASLLAFDAEFDRTGERLGNYAFLKASEDQADSAYLRMKGRYQHVATQAAEAASYIRPEILAIPQATMDQFLTAPELQTGGGWRLALERILRYRPHTLTNKEEQLLAMSGQMAEASNQIFRQLNDTDLKWPVIKDEKGQRVELGHSSFSKFLQSPKRPVRAEAFHKYYTQFEAHKNTLAASYNASVQRDVFYAKARGYPSAREGSLFHDNVPVAVYDSLIAAVRKHLPANHRYLALRGRALKIPPKTGVRMYDTYVPIVAGVRALHPWDSAVKTVVAALAPLGDAYCKTLSDGLTTGRWCDRYPNQGKASGAFSSGGYDGQPYILMNYQPTVLDHVFTLAHEAGHSMHSYFSAKNQPYQYHDYVIFVAEVASTFNEQLLLNHLLQKTTDKNERAYLLNHAIDEIRTTIIRQTMFAEFERVTHALVEKGEPLTVDCLRGEYRKLLDAYFGPDFVIDPQLELECLRIPHFYRAFYVYKYATGLSAAIALSQRVLNGGAKELNAYLSFLKGGCSKFPIDLLKDAGVDMSKPAPVDAAMKHFTEMVDELESLLM